MLAEETPRGANQFPGRPPLEQAWLTLLAASRSRLRTSHPSLPLSTAVTGRTTLQLSRAISVVTTRSLSLAPRTSESARTLTPCEVGLDDHHPLVGAFHPTTDEASLVGAEELAHADQIAVGRGTDILLYRLRRSARLLGLAGSGGPDGQRKQDDGWSDDGAHRYLVGERLVKRIPRQP